MSTNMEQMRHSLYMAIDKWVEESCETEWWGDGGAYWWPATLTDRIAEAAMTVIQSAFDGQDELRELESE